MILLINTCKERLHYYEFVKPIEDILKRIGERYFVKGYLEVTEGDLKKASRVIICGTSLADNDFVDNVNYFGEIILSNKPVLGICAGMQIIGMVFGGKSKKKTEIGYYKEKFKEGFLGLKGEVEVYHLHNNYVSGWEEFKVFAKGRGGVVQAVRHNAKEVYGVLFHPEVRNKKMIERFCEL